jgi:hypothetical protein
LAYGRTRQQGIQKIADELCAIADELCSGPRLGDNKRQTLKLKMDRDEKI